MNRDPWAFPIPIAMAIDAVAQNFWIDVFCIEFPEETAIDLSAYLWEGWMPFSIGDRHVGSVASQNATQEEVQVLKCALSKFGTRLWLGGLGPLLPRWKIRAKTLAAIVALRQKDLALLGDIIRKARNEKEFCMLAKIASAGN